MSDNPSDVVASADRCILCDQEFGAKDEDRTLCVTHTEVESFPVLQLLQVRFQLDSPCHSRV